MKVTILITEDHKLVSESLTMQLNADPRFEVVRQCPTGEEAVLYSNLLKPDIILMDINLPGISGIETTKRIIHDNPRANIIGLSMNNETLMVRRITAAGAKGYLFKNVSIEELLMAIQDVMAGKKYFCNEVKSMLADELLICGTKPPGLHLLNAAEMDIAHYVREGLSSREIAENMDKSLKSILNYRQRILKKLNLSNTVSLVNYMHTQYGGLN